MSLDPAYLEYPHRSRGMDHDLYPWSRLADRSPIAWPGGKAVAVAVVVNLEWFPIIPTDKPFRAPGHMQTTYPDYRHYTSREYGTRVGVYRLLDAFARHGVRASFPTNGAIAARYPSLIADIRAGGHEIVAHSTDMNGTIATGLPEDEERALIQRSLAMLDGAGVQAAGWMSIARSQSWNTPRLLTEAGLAYMADWVNDDLPFRMTTPAGSIINIPVNHELSDRQIITVQQQSADSYAQQMRDACKLFQSEAVIAGGRLLTLNVTPYIMGLPYRIGAFEDLLEWFVREKNVGFLTLAEAAGAAPTS
jgi:allantoinase